MILHGFLPAWGLPDVSPFVTKVDCYLRMCGQTYDYAPAPGGSLESYPQGKAPYLEDSGRIIGDSSAIIEDLEPKNKLDAWLSPEQKGSGLLILRTLERNVYWHIAQNRWIVNFDAYVAELSQATGAPVAVLKDLLSGFRAHLDTMLKVDGVGRHPPAYLEKRVMADFDAIAMVLGSKKYLFGDKPCSFDATLYGFIAQLVWVPFDSPVKAHLLQKKNLISFAENIKRTYYAR